KFYNTAANNGNLSFQIQLYEKDNHAEVHIKELNDPVPSAHTVGLENSTGTKAITNSLRNNVSFSVALGSPEAWSFFPDTNNISYAWSPATYLSSTSTSNPQVVGINSPVNYTVTITGPAGCSQLTRNLFLNVLPNPAPKITPGDTTICSDQTIFLKVRDTGVYAGGYPLGTTVDWIGINNNLSPNDSVPSNLTSNYQAKVILPNGCFGFSNQVTISSRSVSVVPQITNVNCNGVPGKIVVTNVSAPAPPYRYVWTDGTNILRDTISSSISDSLQQLQSGQYFLSIYDNFGGALSCSTLNMMFNVQQQPPLNINLVSKSDITCFGQIDGAIAVSASNGQAPYSYLWSNSSATSSIFGLSPGTYTVTVTDATGCNGSASFNISEPQPINGNFVVQNACYGETNGSITANPTGGTGSYYIEWFDSQTNSITSGVNSISGLTADSYYALIMDANSCQQIDLITVNQNLPLEIYSFSPNPVKEDSILTLTGTGFTQVDSIRINGELIDDYTIVSDNQIDIEIEDDEEVENGYIQLFAGQCSAISDDSLIIIHLFKCYADADNDLYGDNSSFLHVYSLPPGYVLNNDDCNDANANINPSVAEVCNGIDDNCNSQVDDGLIFTTYYVDADGDGFGSTTSLVSCSNPGAGYVLNNT
ncbi:MAG TPA: MopE-related protein, partial [Bacteroidia bacterium]|nr:MopE-related protein [Bacteroidia bacterium]